ncbi:hypothetical protein F4779DRAFT_318541 [Xylariaceae sp. FL0662B]|nr:hypothetical protein F4779DRAFT_318541 [Xylariaceae sp. FL0662B]
MTSAAFAQSCREGHRYTFEAVSAVQNAFKKNWGTSVCCDQLFGMSETSPAAAFAPLDTPAEKPGVEYIMPNMKFRFVDPFTMEDADVGEDEITKPAEIRCQGPNVTKAYLQDKTTEDAFRIDEQGDRWFRTGNMGITDTDGWLQLKDRVADVIRHDGISIFPSELEARLQEHPHLVQSCVTMRPHHSGP